MKLVLRPMEERDLPTTLTWRNDPLVRETSMTSGEVSMAEYEAVFKFTTSYKLIFEYGDDPCGFVSITNSSDNVGVWGFFLAPEARGLGLSTLMLQMALLYAKGEKYTNLEAQVKKTNKASLVLHEKLGFKYTDDETEDFYHFRKKLR
jgi:RimJ/RimL family protein N-acetyltransferase